MSQSHERITQEQINFWAGIETYNYSQEAPIVVQVTPEHLIESERTRHFPSVLPSDEVQIQCVQSGKHKYPSNYHEQ